MNTERWKAIQMDIKKDLKKKKKKEREYKGKSKKKISNE